MVEWNWERNVLGFVGTGNLEGYRGGKHACSFCLVISNIMIVPQTPNAH